MTQDKGLLDEYESRFEHELSLNSTQTAHTRQLISDFMDKFQPLIEKAERERICKQITDMHSYDFPEPYNEAIRRMWQALKSS